jgi:hypothetical protein
MMFALGLLRHSPEGYNVLEQSRVEEAAFTNFNQPVRKIVAGLLKVFPKT